jgi:hypothetical protein
MPTLRVFPSAHAAGWTSTSKVQTSNQTRFAVAAVLVASAADRRISRVVNMRKSLRQNMHNRLHFQNYARKLYGRLEQLAVEERRLAALEKMNPKSVASTKSFSMPDSCLSLARLRHPAMSAVQSLSGEKRT